MSSKGVYIDRAQLIPQPPSNLSYFGSSWLSNLSGLRGISPNLFYNPLAIDYAANGENIIVAQTAGDAVDWWLAEITRAGRVEWSLPQDPAGYAEGCKCLFNPTTGRVLAVATWAPTAPDTHHVVEVLNGVIQQTLTGTTLGAFGTNPQMSVCYDRLLDRIWVADTANHAVYRTDWNGVVDSQFGTYGIPGATLVTLNSPVSVGAFGDTLLIADRGNHRILRINMTTMTVMWQLPHPYPALKDVADHMAVFYGNTGALGGSPQMTYVFGEGALATPPLYMIPTPSNELAFHPGSFFTNLITWNRAIYEMTLSPFIDTPHIPRNQALFRQAAVVAATDYYSPPFCDYFQPNKSITVLSTQSGTLAIEVPEWEGNNAAMIGQWTGNWREIDSVGLVANTPRSYLLTRPCGVVRIRVRPDANGTLDAWVSLSS